MIKQNRFLTSVRKGWIVLEASEKRRAVVVLLVVLISAFMSALMVASIYPFLAVLSDLNQIDQSLFLQSLYSFFDFQSKYGFLLFLGGGSLSIILLANVFLVLRLRVVVSFALGMMHSISTRLLESYLGKPYEFFLQQHTGELGTQILSESQQLVQYFYRPVADVFASAITIVAIVSLLIWINPIVALASLLIGGGIYISSYLLSRAFINKQGSIRTEANKKRFKVSNEVLSGVKEIKLLGRESHYLGGFRDASRGFTLAEANVAVFSQLPLFVMQVVAFGGMIVLSLALLDPEKLAAGSAIPEILPLLGILAFAGQRLVPELSRLYAGVIQINYGAAIIERVFEDLAVEHTEKSADRSMYSGMKLRDAIIIEGVSYRYPDAHDDALKNVSLEIRAGERIGIVGGSGSGKTTLADLLMGLLEPITGEIVIDGAKLTAVNINDWQSSIGYVQQSVFLADASIIENIALGVPRSQIDERRAINAGRIARLQDFILGKDSQSYDTVVGERGVRLSGGQRQRIAIARALYSDAQLIVFDEATSALDSITEKQVMESIDSLPDNKTVIVIAHRLSTLSNCDRIIVMDRGSVVGFDTQAQLEKSNPTFQGLAKAGGIDIER